ncbi:MAG: carbohydrate binding domain-containing protein, partial [Clostridia bacterium]|nr:carbohydrate binding domain-containing protein [Clostridia bacterium]
MKYTLIMFFKKAFAAVLSVITAVLGFIFPETPVERPDANSVTVYDASVADYVLNIDAANELYDISDLLFGIFFEDINFAADGGLYAEKIVNRSFEFTEVALDDELYGWSAVNGAALSVIKSAEDMLNENNPNYLVIENGSDIFAGVQNVGFLDGIAVEAGERYDISFYAKAVNGYRGKAYVKLLCGEKILGEGEVDSLSDEWKKYELTV